jgi:hypothetical protein
MKQVWNKVRIKSTVNVSYKKAKTGIVKHGKKFISVMRVNSAKLENETHFVSLICGFRCDQKWDSGLEFPYLKYCTCLPVLQCLATGWLASLLMTARRCSPNLVLKGLPVSPI